MFRERGLIPWLLLGLVLVVVLNLPGPATRRVKALVREGFAPLQKALAVFGARSREAGTAIRGVSTAVKENREMAAELVRLRFRLGELQALEDENVELRSQLQFARRAERRLVPCEVISRDLSGWWQVLRLGSGRADGIMDDCAVVSSEGLIGKTVDVSRLAADVLLISDPGCKVAARVARSGAFGIVVGQGVSFRGRPVCRMDFINKDVPIRVGDEVVTSGLGGVFPRGLLVGYVERVYQDDSGLFQHADILPKADLGRLTYVFVIPREALRESGS